MKTSFRLGSEKNAYVTLAGKESVFCYLLGIGEVSDLHPAQEF